MNTISINQFRKPLLWQGIVSYLIITYKTTNQTVETHLNLNACTRCNSSEVILWLFCKEIKKHFNWKYTAVSINCFFKCMPLCLNWCWNWHQSKKNSNSTRSGFNQIHVTVITVYRSIISEEQDEFIMLIVSFYCRKFKKKNAVKLKAWFI